MRRNFPQPQERERIRAMMEILPAAGMRKKSEKTWMAGSNDASARRRNRSRLPSSSNCVRPFGPLSGRSHARVRNTDDIFAAIDLVGKVFPLEMISREPFPFLWNMAITAPNKEELNHLAHELGNWLLEEYRQHGDEVLVAANRLGIGPFLEVVRNGEKLNWFDARRMFEQYPRNLSERARRGLVLALLEQVAEPGVDQATLESINRDEELFRRTAPLLQQDVRKLYRLFEDPPAMEIVERAFHRNVDVARGLLIEWPVRTWERYRERDRFDALFNVAEYRVTDQEQAPREFAREIREQDKLTVRFIESGLCGVRLWDTYAGPGAGQRQRREAESAVGLLDEGYPCDLLLTTKGFDDIQLVS